jgi:hypothetical protein
MKLALPTGLNRVGVSFPLPENGNGCSFRNTVFFIGFKVLSAVATNVAILWEIAL